MTRGRAFGRYNRAVLGLSAAYAGLLCAAEYLVGRHHVGGPLAYLFAVLPALPVIGMFGAVMRYLAEEQDEYVRLLTVRQTLVASGLAVSVATILGFLQSFDLAPHYDTYWVAVIWFAGLGLGACVNALIERRS